MKKFFSIAIFLVIAALVSCFGSTGTKTPNPSATPGQATSSTPIQPGQTVQLSPTSEPPPKVVQAPPEGIGTKQFVDAPDRDLFRLTQELKPGGGDISRVVTEDTAEFQVGRTDTFWLVDLTNTETYQSEFELVLVSPHAYWYVEDGLDVDLSGIESSASIFEEQIYPVVTRLFGSEWNPGIDNDHHLNILNTKLSGVAGYFSSNDEYPIGVHPRSNQREIIYINALNVPPGGGNYNQVLAHELQHAIHWFADASEDTWVNEGLAELSSSIALGSTFSIRQFLSAPPISLVNWPTTSVGSIANYGAASLFIHFLTEHYGSTQTLTTLLSQQHDGIAGIDAYLEEMGYEATFNDVFREWAAANILDGDGILGYEDLAVSAHINRRIRGFNESQSDIPQYAVEYVELSPTSEPFTLTFQGPTITPLLPVDVGSTGCWWGNSGDSIDSTLTRRIHLPEGSSATLDYEVWFQIEEDWDYVYIEVSVDDGLTWQIIETPLSSPENPIGNGFGPGYTGDSDGWVSESIDLSSYAGKDIQIRLQYVTDDAVNAAGICFRGLSLLVAGIESGDTDWETNGFVFTDNQVRQRFQVQLITTGNNPQVRQVVLDSENMAEINVQPLAEGQRLYVAVGALAEKTREKVSYTLTVSPAS
jgi:hypothetical protein